MAKYINTSSEITELIPNVSDRGAISSISICNNDSVNQAEVDLYLDNGTDQFYKLNKVKIPNGATLFLDNDLAFNSSNYSLKIKNHSSTKDLTIKIV